MLQTLEVVAEIRKMDIFNRLELNYFSFLVQQQLLCQRRLKKKD